MSCTDGEFRHVCLKDLEHYFKKDDYFADLSEEEIKLILKNLGIASSKDDPSDYNPTMIVSDHESIYNLQLAGALKVGYIYVINNFRSLYLDKNGIVCGKDNKVPSQEYFLMLTPTSSNTFDKRVSLKAKTGASNSTKWIVEYDITPTQFADGSTDFGHITYLKDENNNSAYYDFKNIKFLKDLSELNKGSKTYTKSQYLYTFDNNGEDASIKMCSNNHLEKGATRNVFLGNTLNVYLEADAHDNLFFKNVENCHLRYGFRNNYVLNNMQNCDGSLHDCTLSEIISMSCPKKFDILNDRQVIAYLDSETQTYLFKNV